MLPTCQHPECQPNCCRIRDASILLSNLADIFQVLLCKSHRGLFSVHTESIPFLTVVCQYDILQMFFAHQQLTSVWALRGKSFPRVKALTYQLFGVPVDDVEEAHKLPTEMATNTGQEVAHAELVERVCSVRLCVEAPAFTHGVLHKQILRRDWLTISPTLSLP
jgi:hypothetical protein